MNCPQDCNLFRFHMWFWRVHSIFAQTFIGHFRCEENFLFFEWKRYNYECPGPLPLHSCERGFQLGRSFDERMQYLLARFVHKAITIPLSLLLFWNASPFVRNYPLCMFFTLLSRTHDHYHHYNQLQSVTCKVICARSPCSANTLRVCNIGLNYLVQTNKLRKGGSCVLMQVALPVHMYLYCVFRILRFLIARVRFLIVL